MGWTDFNYYGSGQRLVMTLEEMEGTKQMSFAKELKKLADAENDRRADELRKLRTENFLNDMKKDMLALAKKGFYVCKFYAHSDTDATTIRERLNDLGLRIMQMIPKDNGHHFEVSWAGS